MFIVQASLLALATAPDDPDASLAILREVQAQVQAGNALGLPRFWVDVILATNTTDWDAASNSFTSFVTPRAVSLMLVHLLRAICLTSCFFNR